MTFQRDGEVLLFSWRDTKVITMVSAMHSAEVVEVSNKFGRKWMKPECVADCNTFMQEVDNAYQYLAFDPYMRKTDKWPKKGFFYLLHCALFNSFRAFVKSNQAVRVRCLDFVKIVSHT
jgi:hypothetical protein